MPYQAQAKQLIHLLAQTKAIDAHLLNERLVDIFSLILSRQIIEMEGTDIDWHPAFDTLLSVFTWVSIPSKQRPGTSPTVFSESITELKPTLFALNSDGQLGYDDDRGQYVITLDGQTYDLPGQSTRLLTADAAQLRAKLGLIQQFQDDGYAFLGQKDLTIEVPDDANLSNRQFLDIQSDGDVRFAFEGENQNLVLRSDSNLKLNGGTLYIQDGTLNVARVIEGQGSFSGVGDIVLSSRIIMTFEQLQQMSGTIHRGSDTSTFTVLVNNQAQAQALKTLLQERVQDGLTTRVWRDLCRRLRSHHVARGRSSR